MSVLLSTHTSWHAALTAAGCRNIREESLPPDPMVSQDQIRQFLYLPDSSELEAWWVDRDRIETDSTVFRTTSGEFWSRQMWEVFGVLYRVSDPPDSLADWYASYEMINDRLEALTAWMEGNVNLNDSALVTVDSWNWDVMWHKEGENYLWLGSLNTTLIVALQ